MRRGSRSVLTRWWWRWDGGRRLHVQQRLRQMLRQRAQRERLGPIASVRRDQLEARLDAKEEPVVRDLVRSLSARMASLGSSATPAE